MTRWTFLALLLVHGSIHFMGFAKAFELGEFPQLTLPISRPIGIVWLLAGMGMLATGGLLFVAPRTWWAVGFGAVVISQVVIFSSWGDARFGTIANVLVLAGVVYGFASQGPFSLRTEYRESVRERRDVVDRDRVLSEADLEPLPEPVQEYLRVTGALGQPRPHHFRAAWTGRIRATESDAWMEFAAEQHNFLDEPARFFLMDATRSGLPVDVFHAFRGESATMEVRLLSLLPITRTAGPELTRAETVTLLNDLALMAPGALTDPSIEWESIDARSARAHYTVGENTVSAELIFNEAGELVDFVSEDRLAASPDGREFVQRRWSTPVEDYRSFGPRRLMSRGEGRWHPSEGAFTYIELELTDLEVDGAP